MALTPQPLRRADDPAGYTAVLGPTVPKNWRVWSNKFQPNERANDAGALHPDPSNPADWHGGDFGNDVDVADATQAIAGQNGGIHPDYEPRHQEEKAEDYSNPPVVLLEDIGLDYGEFTGLTGRTGEIPPEGRYPSVNTDETPEQFRRSNYIPILPPEPEP